MQKLVKLQDLSLHDICGTYQMKLLVLALFSERVTNEDKELLMSNLTKPPLERKVRGDPPLLKNCVATSRTANLFSRLDMDSSFLSKPPAQWNEDKSYQMAKRRVQHLRVVNDTAE